MLPIYLAFVLPFYSQKTCTYSNVIDIITIFGVSMQFFGKVLEKGSRNSRLYFC